MKAKKIDGVLVHIRRGKVYYTLPRAMSGKNFAVWQRENYEEVERFIHSK